MTDAANRPAESVALPADDLDRTLAVVNPDGPGMRHLSIAGGVYTILLSGAQTGGRYCLVDMLVPPGGGPPPHRHDFEEMFTVLEGEVEVTFRGAPSRAVAGSTINVPANAPHAFKNKSDKPARLLCMCTPPGQEEFFLAVGAPLASRTATAPEPSPEEQAELGKKVRALAVRYRTETLA